MSSWPICTPSASAASATSTRSLISSGTPAGSSTARSARASSTMARVEPCLSRNCTSVALPAISAGEIGKRAAAGDGGIDKRIKPEIDVHQFTFARAMSVGPSRS